MKEFLEFAVPVAMVIPIVGILLALGAAPIIMLREYIKYELKSAAVLAILLAIIVYPFIFVVVASFILIVFFE